MTLSIRLGDGVELEVREQAASYNVTVSEFVRMAINEKIAKDQKSTHPFAVGDPVFGRYSSGESDRAENAEALLREKLIERHRR